MKSKIVRGSDFFKCSDYILNDEKNAEIIGGNLSGVTAIDMAEELNAIASQRPEIKKPVWHSSLSAVTDEKLSDEKWNEIAQDYMKGLGFDLDKTPYMIVRHQDKPYEHIHIEASRVAIDGSLYLGKNENLKATKISQQLEKKYGLIRTKGPGYDPLTGRIIRHEDSKSAKPLTPGERKMSERTGEITPRQRLQEIISTAVKGRPTQLEYENKLNQAGVKFKRSSNGYSYQLDGIPFKGSQLGTAFKWAQLQKTFTTPEQMQQRAIQAARAAAWIVEKGRRDRFRANRSVANSICQMSYTLLPRPLGQVVQSAVEVISLIAKINDWQEANIYRDQVKELTARMNRIKVTNAEKFNKVVQVPPPQVQVQKTESGKPSLEPVVRSTDRPTEALPPQEKNKHFHQQPVVDLPSLTATAYRDIERINRNIVTLNKSKNVSQTEYDRLLGLYAKNIEKIISTFPGIKVTIDDRPCPVEINGKPISEIIKVMPPEQAGIGPTQGRKL